MMKNEYDIFISYSRKDTKIADQVCANLDELGIKYFIDRKGVYSGDQFMQVLAESILNSKFFLLLCSRNSYESEYTQKEINFAIKRKRTIIPYIIDDSPMPPLYQFAFANLNYREMKSFSPADMAREIKEMLCGKPIGPPARHKRWYEGKLTKIAASTGILSLVIVLGCYFLTAIPNDQGAEVEVEVSESDSEVKFLDCNGLPLEGEREIIPGTFQSLVDSIRKRSDSMLHDSKGNGYDVVTTIDLGLQLEAQNAILPTLQELDATNGMMVVMDVKTGDIRAMVNLTKTRGGYYEMSNDALSCQYEPGSSIFPASIMVPLERSLITADTEVDTGNGLCKMYDTTIKDWSYGDRGGFGIIDVTTIIEQSSNVGVAKLIDEYYRNNPQEFIQELKRAGLTLPSELGRYVSGVKESTIQFPDDISKAQSSLPMISIGYESLFTPVNILTFYNAIANNGKMVRPRILRYIKDGEEFVQKFNVEVIRKEICSSDTREEIVKMLYNCVDSEQGTGKRGYSPIFKVCGKPFTVNVGKRPKSNSTIQDEYYIGFCGFFPADNPKYSCIVSMTKSGLPASGGNHCAPIFHDFAESVYSKYVRNSR